MFWLRANLFFSYMIALVWACHVGVPYSIASEGTSCLSIR